MRKIGELKNEKDALNLWSYLKTENIETTLEKEEDKSWSIWVSEEDKVKVAQKELSEFVANPENKKYISISLLLVISIIVPVPLVLPDDCNVRILLSVWSSPLAIISLK